jgi:hypothetical protein
VTHLLSLRSRAGSRISSRIDDAIDRFRRRGRDAGAATAEYAVVIMAAVGFAGLLVVILKSGAVQGMLTDLVHRALTVAG